MRALILNSGAGRRLGALTADRPKCLLELGKNDTILGRQLDLLARAGVREVAMTTGPFARKLREYAGRRFPSMAFVFVHNPRHRSTNYIYSLFLARGALAEGGLLFHGDMVFDGAVLEKLLRAPAADAVLARQPKVLPEKDFKGRISRGRVAEISVSLSGPDCLEILPVYKLSDRGWRIWMGEIERWVKRGRTDVYAEEAFKRVSGILALEPVLLGKRLCLEIDTEEDLRRARRLVR